MLGSEIAQEHPGSGSTYATPAALPMGSGWGSWLAGYGATDWFEFTAQANRTASIAVTALDESGNPTESKLMPIIGLWQLSDESENPAPAATQFAFDSMTFGMSRLDAQFVSSDTFRLGIADYRGDGRPDYSYQASLLYSDTVTPARLSVAGGVTTLEGIGFKPGLQVSAGGNYVSVLSQSASQMEVSLPGAALDGTAAIQVTDPSNGSFSQMIGALTYGAASTDRLLLLQGSKPATPIGAQAANLLRVRAVASDGVTPVSGATIAWTATNGATFSACSGASSCSVLSDGAGEASTWVTPTALGQSGVTAALAPGSYSPPQTQQAMLIGTSSTLDLAAIAPTRWIGQGATVNLPLTVEALNMGAPKPNVAINYTIAQGAASLSSGTATTNSSGLASVTAQMTNLISNVQVSACVAPGNNPCQTFTLFATPASMWKIETFSGSSQVVPMGQSFQPLVIRVTDGSAADNPVSALNVTFVTTLERISQGPGGPPPGDDYQGGSGTPVILGTSQTQVTTDQYGLASIIPSVGTLGPCAVFITVSAGSSVAQFALESVDPITTPQQHNPHHDRARPIRVQARNEASQPTAAPDLANTFFAVAATIPDTQSSAVPCSSPSEHIDGGANDASSSTDLDRRSAESTGAEGSESRACPSSETPDNPSSVVPASSSVAPTITRSDDGSEHETKLNNPSSAEVGPATQTPSADGGEYPR
jgi:hypothetical protein